LPISTGVSGLGANVATFLSTPSSATLAAAVTDETGTGQLVFNTNPTINTPTINSATLTSPALGTPVSGTLTNCTGFPAGNLSGLVPLALGGTGASTQPSALNNLCPPQSAPQAGFVLTTDGAGNITWNFNPGGTITSITLDGSTTGLTINSAPSATITTSGTFTLGGVLAPSNGGTGISSLGAGVQASLGAAVDTVGGFATFPAGSFPAGAVVYFAMPTAPAGWLFCDGGSVSTTTYASLFAAIGYTYGGGGASFNLPNLNGQFIRSWDASGAVDPGRVFGSNQGSLYQNHTHTATSTDSGHAHGILNTGPNANGGGGGWLVNPQANTGLNTLTGQANITTTVNASTTGGNETRPVNVALYACIKF
jgi:microcystin-dependent protein